MKGLAAWAAPLLLLLPALAAADVHVCRDANGRKVFSDSPCGPDAKVLKVAPATGGPFVHPQETTQVDYYDVSGAKFDMELSTDPRPPLAVWKQLEGATPLGYVDGTMFPASFSHIASNYAAGYYGYMWSQVLALDMLSPFQ